MFGKFSPIKYNHYYCSGALLSLIAFINVAKETVCTLDLFENDIVIKQ